MVCMGQGEGAGRSWHARSWLGAAIGLLLCYWLGFWDPAVQVLLWPWESCALLGAVTRGQAWPCSALLPNSLWKPFPVLCSSDQTLFPTAAPMHTPLPGSPSPEPSLLPLLSPQCILIPCYTSVLSPPRAGEPPPVQQKDPDGTAGPFPSTTPSRLWLLQPSSGSVAKMPTSTFEPRFAISADAFAQQKGRKCDSAKNYGSSGLGGQRSPQSHVEKYVQFALYIYMNI